MLGRLKWEEQRRGERSEKEEGKTCMVIRNKGTKAKDRVIKGLPDEHYNEIERGKTGRQSGIE